MSQLKMIADSLRIPLSFLMHIPIPKIVASTLHFTPENYYVPIIE
jgi:hypothetical protein